MKRLILDGTPFNGTEEEFLAVEKFLYKQWKLNGRLHRIDGPAVIYSDGSEQWHQNGKFHRVDGPAVTRSNGYHAWCQNGELHRIDGPAVIWLDGTLSWYQNGKYLNWINGLLPLNYWICGE